MKYTHLLSLALLSLPIYAQNTTDLSRHSRETQTPIGRLDNQDARFRAALMPFVERCREAGKELYERHEHEFPYDGEGKPNHPLAQAWYLPGTWYNDANPNVGITLSVALHTAELPTLSVGHLIVSGRKALAENLAQRNRDYVMARGGPALRCDVMIQGLLGKGESNITGPVYQLAAALNPNYRINRQRIRILLDDEAVITENTLYGQFDVMVADKNADMLHQQRAAQISRVDAPGATTEVETTWRVHGKRQPGAYLRVKQGDELLYRCDMKVDGDQLNAQCGLMLNAEIWGFNQLGDEPQLVNRARASVEALKASKDPSIEHL